MSIPAPADFPGTLYDGRRKHGTCLAGDGPEFTPKLTESLPYKALLEDRPRAERVAVLTAGDRLWVLPDTFGTPPELPVPLLTELAHVVRCGRKIGLATSHQDTYALVRDALMLLLGGSSGRA